MLQNEDYHNVLLQKAIDSIVKIKEKSDIDSSFSIGETTALQEEIQGQEEFEKLIPKAESKVGYVLISPNLPCSSTYPSLIIQSPIVRWLLS